MTSGGAFHTNTCTDCSTCGARLGADPHRRRKTTLCKPCHARFMSQSPSKREKCRAAMKARFENPDYHRVHTARTTAGIRAAMNDPAFIAQKRELGRAVGLKHLGFNTYPAGCPERVAAGIKASNTKMAWCPPEYRDGYHHLVRSQLIRAAEARRITEALIAADIRTYHKGYLPQAEFMKVRAALRYLAERAGA